MTFNRSPQLDFRKKIKNQNPSLRINSHAYGVRYLSQKLSNRTFEKQTEIFLLDFCKI